MASGGKEPPDASLNKFYKCHPTTKVGAVVCVLCGNFYHTSEFVAKYNTGAPVKFLSNSFVICQDHPSFAITSKLPYGELSPSACEFIAQLKFENREAIKQDILAEIIHEKNIDTNLDTTVYEGYTEIQALKIENSILTQLYKETKDKNALLNELLTIERGKNKNNNDFPINTNKNTYSEILTKSKPKAKKVPKLIIKKSNTNAKVNLENELVKCLT
jgi:hypothetical protein